MFVWLALNSWGMKSLKYAHKTAHNTANAPTYLSSAAKMYVSVKFYYSKTG